MRVDEIIDFDQYRTARRFRAKRPDMRAPGKAERFGDNIYERDSATGLFTQDFSFHSNPDGSRNEKNVKRDTVKTERILIGHEFAYFGIAAPEIPEDLRDLIKKGPSHKCRFKPNRVKAFEAWVIAQPGRGYIGKPTHWRFLK